jgi:hypothetical protein
LSETLSDNPGQKLYTNYKAKRMVTEMGKRKNLTTPPNNPGPKCRGEILIYIPWQKRYLFPGKNLKIISPPLPLYKNMGRRLVGKIYWAKDLGAKI